MRIGPGMAVSVRDGHEAGQGVLVLAKACGLIRGTTVRFWPYATRDGLRIPLEGEVAWHYLKSA